MQLEAAGIIKRTAHALNKKGIYTLDDLARFFPKRYHDYREIKPLNDAIGTDCAICGYMEDIAKDNKSGRTLLKAYVIEASSGEKIRIMWFGQAFRWSYLGEMLQSEVVVCGKVRYDKVYGYSICNPEYFCSKQSFYGRIVPVYGKVKGISEKTLNSAITLAINRASEPLDEEIIKEKGWMDYKTALQIIHKPKNFEQLEQAQYRIATNDLLYFSLSLKKKPAAGNKTKYVIKNTDQTEKLLKSLPFELTNDQKSAYLTIKEDMTAGRRANYLIQGDVSCGKTIVAFLCAMMMADNGYQTAIMAPTSVLAYQHYAELLKYAKKCGKTVVYLHSGMKTKEKKEALAKIVTGEAEFVVGTHSVISKDVMYFNLGLVITDEEHRFGVKQREALFAKASESAHVISMSATPIPRTVASVLYGEDKKIITINTMPKGRMPVQSFINNNDTQIIRFIEQEAKKGHQAYIVCPLIEEADDGSRIADVRSVDETAALYGNALKRVGITLEALNGKMKKEEIEEILTRFKEGKTQVLVSTTVVEVGVNVPNANIMVISNAERFGLATLHQLRGRVGRGTTQGYCILKSKESSNERLQIIKRTTNGFEIAKEDLRLRGMGDLLGTKQSGASKLLDLAISMPELYEQIQILASEMVKKGQGKKLIALYNEKEEILEVIYAG